MLGSRRPQRVEQRVVGAGRVARGRLRLGQPALDRGVRARAVGQQPQRGSVEARGRCGRGRLQLARGGAEQCDRGFVAAGGGLLDVVRPLHRSGTAALERRRRAGVGAEPPAARRRDVDRVADDRVAEGEAARCGARPHQCSREQLVERVQAHAPRAARRPRPPAPGRTGRRPPPRRRAAGAHRRSRRSARRPAPPPPRAGPCRRLAARAVRAGRRGADWRWPRRARGARAARGRTGCRRCRRRRRRRRRRPARGPRRR